MGEAEAEIDMNPDAPPPPPQDLDWLGQLSQLVCATVEAQAPTVRFFLGDHEEDGLTVIICPVTILDEKSGETVDDVFRTVDVGAVLDVLDAPDGAAHVTYIEQDEREFRFKGAFAGREVTVLIRLDPDEEDVPSYRLEKDGSFVELSPPTPMPEGN